ncbi:trypsin-like serine protease [Amycolatopsis arida]|uniref:trypsin-like serine protease n=1 Tax=Amycolatopsis arida TaxID=587909 RepID=UPI0010658592|nr:trypsin-like serine protease [Amycolatopsis arida]
MAWSRTVNDHRYQQGAGVAFIRKISIAAAAATAVVAGVAPAQAIEGGSRATVSEFPFMVMLHNKHWLYGWSNSCGGVLVTTIHVLTAASCINPRVNINTDYRVTSGEDDTGKDEGREVVRSLSNVQFHPDYGNNVHDLAVLTLSTSLDLDGQYRYLKTAKLSEPGFPGPVGTPAEVAGWGGHRMVIGERPSFSAVGDGTDCVEARMR